jgi:hypothetical protein
MIVQDMKSKFKRISPTRRPLASNLLLLWATIVCAVVLIGGCSDSQGQVSGTEIRLPTTAVDDFIEGVWVDQWLLNKVKAMELDSAWPSLRNFTHFGTYRDEKGEPRWTASVPDRSGTLSFKSGSWYDGEQELIAFQFDKGDTLAQYHFTEGGYQEDGVGPIRTYQKVPRFREGDTYIPDGWLYQLYYFPGSYEVELVSGTSSVSSEARLTSSGKVLGMKEWSEYSLSIGNSLPILNLKSSEGLNHFVIEGTPTGFILSDVMNEDLDGLDLDIIKGPQIFKFVRKP